jgi:hypothetical protein
MTAGHSITAEDTVALLKRLLAERSAAPERIRCDNGPELVAHALRDWCRLNCAPTAYIESGSPWQNPLSSHSGRARDEVLDVELFHNLAETKVISPTGSPPTTPNTRIRRWGCCPRRALPRAGGRRTAPARRLPPLALRARCERRRPWTLRWRRIRTRDSHRGLDQVDRVTGPPKVDSSLRELVC